MSLDPVASHRLYTQLRKEVGMSLKFMPWDPEAVSLHSFCSVSKDITVLKYNYDLHLVPYYFCWVCSEEDWKSQIRRPPADQRYRRLDRIPL